MSRLLQSGVVVVGLLIGASSAPLASERDVRAQIEALHGDPDSFEEVFETLRQAMTYGDPVTVADLASYPLTVRANGEVYDVLEAQDLLDNYDNLVAPATRDLVAEQDFGRLFVNSDGVMLGNGEVWMRAWSAATKAARGRTG